MAPKFQVSFLLKVTLAMWLLSTVFVLFFLNKIDGIIHGELYNYGLQFSFGWATGYWVLLRSLYICLAVPSALSIIALGLSLVKRVNGGQSASQNGNKPGYSRVQTSQNSMIINCPNCRRMFSKPLTMLDFSTRKAKLVSVCPYCSYVLGKADEKNPSNIQVLEPEKKEVP